MGSGVHGECAPFPREGRRSACQREWGEQDMPSSRLTATELPLLGEVKPEAGCLSMAAEVVPTGAQGL